MFVAVNNNMMGTKVRKKGSKRVKVAVSLTKAWTKAKAKQGKTVFALMVETGLSEGTIRTAMKGYADKKVVEKISKALLSQHEQAA